MTSEGQLEEQSTMLHMRVDATPLPTAAYALEVFEGQDTPRRFVIDGMAPPRLLLGQGVACDFRLADRSVSRRHAALELCGKRLRLTDLGSTNGTFVDGLSVVDAYLRGGEVVRVGATALRVEPIAGPSEVMISDATEFGSFVGASTEIRRLFPLFERLASSDVPVIIEGETGTGKEVLAEALHRRGARAGGPFVIFDCTAVPASLAESELFGHERGAFTGAVATRKGVFEQADGGTLFIDELGDLDPLLQPKLLRVLERSEVRRVGGDRWLHTDARIIAATRRDLDREVQAGRFRDDLYHRLAVGRLELPPLRSRRGDVAVLARYFADQIGNDASELPSSLVRRWEDYRWPGNVRELRNAVARHLALGEFAALRGSLDDDEPSDFLDNVLTLGLPFTEARRRVQDEFEQRYVKHMLTRHGGNVVRAAEASGLARRYFQKLKARGVTR